MADKPVINIQQKDFGGRLRSGDILGICNILEHIRKVEQNTDIKYHLSDEAIQPDEYVIKLNSIGDTIWTRTFGGVNVDDANDVKQTSDGGFIIAGYTQSFGAGHDDVYLIKCNASGDTMWTKTFGDTLYDGAKTVETTNDGGYMIGGFANEDIKKGERIGPVRVGYLRTPIGRYTNHSINPNCEFNQCLDGLDAYAVSDIAKDQEITVCYHAAREAGIEASRRLENRS